MHTAILRLTMLACLAVAANAAADAAPEAAPPPAGPTPGAATAAATPVSSAWVVRRMQIRELKQRMDAGEKLVVLDDRPATFGDMIKGAIWVPYGKIAAWAEGRAKDEMIVIYCACHAEATSGRGVRELQTLGFTNVWALQGGLSAWTDAGYPVQATPAEP